MPRRRDHLPARADVIAEGSAWVADGARVFVARGRQAPHAPLSPVTALIFGVYFREPARARKILRGRIFTDLPPTPMCAATVKVAAKRLSFDPTAKPPTDLPAIDVTGELPLAEPVPFADNFEAAPEIPDDPATWFRIARRLAATPQSTSELPRYARDRPVGAVLVSAEGRLLARGRNAGSVCRPLHAEVNLVQTWHRRTGRGLPAGSRIYVSLKCCRMCAAMIWQTAEDIRTLKIYYAENDPGPNARATALDLGTYDRARAAGEDAELLKLELQFRFNLAEHDGESGSSFRPPACKPRS